MNEDDDDDVSGIAGTESGSDSSGTGGQDGDGNEGDDASSLAAGQSDDQADDGSSEDEGKVEAKPPSRGEARLQKLANEAKAAKEEAARARRETEELRRQQWQASQTVTEQQERERLALMTPEERAEYRIEKMQRELAVSRQQDRIQTAALLDKTAYDAKATINPTYAKFKDEVEARFQDQLAKGQPVEREVILKFLLGERALNGAVNSGKAAKAAKSRVEAQKVSSGSGKGDAASQRGKAGDSPEKRLAGVII